MITQEIDPYRLLEVPKNFTLEQLKQNYKKLMLKYHPDKNYDINSPIASMLTAAYKKLVEDYAYRVSNKEFHDLKQDSRGFIDKQIKVKSDGNKKFNLQRFNEIFDQNKTKDDGYDDGYERWMQSEKSFKQSNDKNWSIVKRMEPQALAGGKHTSAAYELGVSKVTDYSGENTSLKNLNYMDYRLAHTTSKIIDEKVVKQRREYKSVQDIEQERSKLSFVMPDAERFRYERTVMQDKEREEHRRKVQEMKDLQMAQAYQRAQFALGYR